MQNNLNWKFKESNTSNEVKIQSIPASKYDEEDTITFNKDTLQIKVYVAAEGYSYSTNINAVELLKMLGLEDGLTDEVIEKYNSYQLKKHKQEMQELREKALSKLTEEEKQALGL